MDTSVGLEQLKRDARLRFLMMGESLERLEGLSPWNLRSKRELAVQAATVCRGMQGVESVYLFGSLARYLMGGWGPIADVDLVVVANFSLDTLEEVVPARRAGYALGVQEFVNLFRKVTGVVSGTLLALDPSGELIDLVLLPAQMTRENMVQWAKIAGRTRDPLFIRSIKEDLLAFSDGQFVHPEAIPWEDAVETIVAEGMTLKGGHDDEPLGIFYGDFGDLRIFLPKDRAWEITRQLGDRLERDLLARYARPMDVLWHDIKRAAQAICCAGNNPD